MVAKRVFQVVALALVALGLTGAVRVMRDPQSEIDIKMRVDAGPERVFQALTQKGAISKWMGQLKSISMPDAHPIEVGTVIEFVFTDRGTDASAQWRVTELTRDRSIQFEIDNPGILARTRLQLLPDGKGTELAFEHRARYRSWVARALEPWIKKATEAKWKEDLERLKQVLETQPQ